MPDLSPQGDPTKGPHDQGRLQAIAAGIERDYPLRAWRTLVSLVDLDPEQFQAQWQVEAGQLALVLGAFPAGQAGLHQRLRLLRLDTWPQEVASLDLPVAELGAQGVARFLVVEGANCAYQVELGLVSPEGGWVLLGRSQPARLPGRSQPANDTGHAPPSDQPSPYPSANHTGLIDPALQADFTPSAHRTGLFRPNLSSPASMAAMAGDEGVADGTLLSPPWDPSLADPGYPLDPWFPMPSRRTHLKAGTDAGEGLGRRRIPFPGSAIPPLVIARTPSPLAGKDGASPLGPSKDDISTGTGLGAAVSSAVPASDAASTHLVSGAAFPAVVPLSYATSASGAFTLTIPLGDATSPGAGPGPASPAGVPRLRSLGRLPSFSRPWGQPESATGCWLFDYETRAEVSAACPSPEAPPRSTAPA